jgi:hypothetical protein
MSELGERERERIVTFILHVMWWLLGGVEGIKEGNPFYKIKLKRYWLGVF